MKVHVIGDHKIEIPVVIIITERRSSRPSAIGNSSRLSNIGEGSVAVVPEQLVSAEAGEIKIRPSVVVVIADRAAHREARRSQPRFSGNVGKCSAVIVWIQQA